jgi:hypothetical protein
MKPVVKVIGNNRYFDLVEVRYIQQFLLYDIVWKRHHIYFSTISFNSW